MKQLQLHLTAALRLSLPLEQRFLTFFYLSTPFCHA